jgi:SPW repeat
MEAWNRSCGAEQGALARPGHAGARRVIVSVTLDPWFAGATPVGAEQALAGPPAAAWNAWVVGAAVAALAIWAIAMFAEWQDWLTGILGLWLVIAPWVLGFGSLAAAAWNSVIVGLLVLAFAVWELWVVRQKATA